MTYYKATRPDGFDFRTGTINYAAALESGEVIRHPAKRVRNQPETYLSVSVEPADCTGFQWPCRLFRVEPVGRVMTADGLPNKRAVSALRVVEELPAHLVFGPNGEEVAALIERVGRLTRDEAHALAKARASARASAWDSAWASAWASARDSAWAAADACVALLVKDLINTAQFDLLYGPWKSVMEQ